MKKSLRWAKAEGWNAVEIDVQACNDEAAMLEAIVGGFRKSGIDLSALDQLIDKVNKFRGWLTGIKVSQIVEFGNKVESHWNEGASALENVFATLADSGKQTLIGVDELPIFLSRLSEAPEGKKRISLVLSWLRNMQQEYAKNVQWIVCGSIGLDTFVERHGLSGTINLLQSQKLGAYDQKTARRFLDKLSKSSKTGLPMSDEVIECILEKVGWHLPYYLQLSYHALRNLDPEKRSRDYPSFDDVEASWNELLGPNYSKEFAHWKTRLTDQFQSSGSANFLLNHICRYKRGLSRAKLYELFVQRSPNKDPEKLGQELSDILVVLERDGYLQKKISIYSFRSPLLREFWRRRNT
ncbi:MAG: hypothetical protein AAF696_17755 [Bacteroidota bacterium]